MGLSASQARLLYLTAQLNNLSLKGQEVSDAKTRLAMDTQEIQNRYIEALNNSRLYLNTNIFSTTGPVTKTEFISLDNLKANGLMVSDGSKILGYKWEEVETGETEWLPLGGVYEDDLDRPIFNTKKVDAVGFQAPDNSAIGDIAKMQAIVDATGLTDKDLEVQSYTTKINGENKNLNTVVIKSQEGFDAIYNTLQNEALAGNLTNALQQNYVLDMDIVDFSKYISTGIKFFQGVFDGNGATIKNLNGTQGLFRDVYGTIKSVNIDGATIAAESDSLGAIAGFLGDGGLIENCNVTNLNLICALYNKAYDEGYDSERCGVGGAVGYNNGSIKNTSVQGTVNVPHADNSFGYIGGFIGANGNTEYGSEQNVIENCYSDVNVVLGSGTNYSNAINGFIGDDTYEAIIRNCISLGSIKNSSGKPINGSDLANWGPVIESNLTNFIAIDTRNNNDILYWENQENPTFANGSRTQPEAIRDAQTELSDGSKVYTWLNPGAPGYKETAQISARNNKLPVLNLNAIQQDALNARSEKIVTDFEGGPIGYQQKEVYIEVPKKEYRLVEDPNFTISTLALEEGLRNGSYTLVQQSDESTTQTITLNGLFFNTVDLSSCSMISDETDQEAINKAEAEYNRDMAEIQIKDKRYEMDQKKIDTQYQAYLAEEESIKIVLGKNVERSFKTFG